MPALFAFLWRTTDAAIPHSLGLPDDMAVVGGPHRHRGIALSGH